MTQKPRTTNLIIVVREIWRVAEAHQSHFYFAFASGQATYIKYPCSGYMTADAQKPLFIYPYLITSGAII